MSKKEEKKLKLTLNEGKRFFVYEGDKFEMSKKLSNDPHLNVEDARDWKSHKEGDNPNLIGQIHIVKDEAVFHLCYNPSGRILDREMMEAILKGMDYVDKYWKEKKREHKK